MAAVRLMEIGGAQARRYLLPPATDLCEAHFPCKVQFGCISLSNTLLCRLNIYYRKQNSLQQRLHKVLLTNGRTMLHAIYGGFVSESLYGQVRKFVY